MTKGILLLCLIFSLTICFSQSHHEKKKYLKEHAVVLNSDSIDFSYLAPLIADKDFIFLSDGHQTATSKIYFTAFIQFLHNNLGFNVLVMETGLVGAEIANDEMHLFPQEAVPIAQKYMASFITDCNASSQLFNYIGTTKSSPQPLEVAGIDIELNKTRTALFENLDAILKLHHDPVFYSGNYKQFKYCVDSLATPLTSKKLSATSKSFLINYADTLGKVVKNISPKDTFLQLTIENLQAYIKCSMNASPIENSDCRNDAMYQNLLYLMRNKYPGEKFIIWASPAHLAQGFFEGETAMAKYFYTDFPRHKVFYLASTSYTVDSRGATLKKNLAADLHDAKLDCCILLLHQPDDEKSILNQYKDSRFFDAVLYYDNMKSCGRDY